MYITLYHLSTKKKKSKITTRLKKTNSTQNSM